MTASDVGSWIADSSISYGSCWGDYDNDGYLDLFIGNDGPHSEGYSNFLIHNNGDGTFTKITDGAINDSTFIKACAWADYDNDGDLDLISGRDGKNILFENNGNSNHWLNITLVDTRTNTNTSAIGSRVEVYAPTKQIREVTAQTGAGGQNSLRQHFGLGSATSVDSVVVKWLNNNGNNNRIHTAYSHLPSDKFMIYTYGDLNVTASIFASRNFMYLFGNTGSAIEFTSNSDLDGGSLTVQRFTTGPVNNTFSGSATAPDGSTVTPNVAAADRYWSITESGLTGNFTVTVYLDISNLSGVSNADKLVIMSRADASSPWQPHNTLRMGNTLYASGITHFSQFTIGSNSNDNSLPVTLISFSAENMDGLVLLRWQTASEIENLGFIIERKTNNSTFNEIASFKTTPRLKGKGNSNVQHNYSFKDKSVEIGKTYIYRLSDISYNGQQNILATTSIKVELEIRDFRLIGNFPNPFNPATKIKYVIPTKLNTSGQLNIMIFNSLGKKIRDLFHGYQQQGFHEIIWDGRNNSGKLQASGIYYVLLRMGSKTQIGKLVMLK